MIARRYLIRGRVQGVGFRQYAVLAARRLGIAGWARNLTDGTVEVFAQTEPETMDRFTAELKDGPRWARVEALEMQEDNVDPAVVDFSVRW